MVGHADDAAAAAARRLRPALLASLRSRFRALAPDHEDLVQQTLVDLFRYLRTSGEAIADESEIDRIAFTIMRRRAADRVRSSILQAALPLDEGSENLSQDAPSLDVVVRNRLFLGLVTQELGKMSEADRAALLDETLGHRDDSARSASERQRLSRARARLRSAVEQRIGMTIKVFLGG